jgi:hypothetical protein
MENTSLVVLGNKKSNRQVEVGNILASLRGNSNFLHLLQKK